MTLTPPNPSINADASDKTALAPVMSDVIPESTMKSDDELVNALIPHWYATRRWAEELLCRSLGLTDAQEVLRNRLPKEVPA